MNLCSAGHDEVCFEGRNCPCCLLLDVIAGLEKDLENLKVDEEPKQ